MELKKLIANIKITSLIKPMIILARYAKKMNRRYTKNPI